MHDPPLHVLPPFLDLLALTAIVGVLSSLLWVLPRSRRAEEMAGIAAARRRLTSLFSCALVLLTVTSAAILVVRSAEMSGQPYISVPSVLPTILFKTHYGAVWFSRLAALLILWTAMPFMRRAGSASLFILMFMAAATIAWTYSATGHAADKGDFTLTEMMDWLHIVAVSVWGGSLVAVTVAIWPALKVNSETRLLQISEVCHRLSRLAGFALVVVLVTGSYSVWRQIPAFAALWGTAYGRFLSLKLFLVLMMVLLGTINRYVVLPGLPRRGQPAAPSPPWFKRYFPWIDHLFIGSATQAQTDLVRQFFRRLSQETLLMVIVLGCVAFLIHSPPPHSMHAGAMHHDGMRMSGTPQS